MSSTSTRLLWAACGLAVAAAAGVAWAMLDSPEARVASASSASSSQAAEAFVVDVLPRADVAVREAVGRDEAAERDTPLTKTRVEHSGVQIEFPTNTFRERPVLPGCNVSGVVVDRDGKPIELAKVTWMGAWVAQTSDDGSFAFNVSPESLKSVREDAPLVARKDGYAPAIVERYGATVLQAGAGRLYERLVLGAPLAIRGRVLDRDGKPVARGRVRVVDGTPLDGDSSRREFVEQAAQPFDSAAGFTIGGLLPRSYVLELELHQPMLTFRTAPIAAGTMDLELRVPDEALVERVRGYLVSPDGAGIEGAALDIALEFTPDVMWPRRSALDKRPRVVTGRGGAFELRDVPSAGAAVLVGHADVPEHAIALAGFDLQSEITLVARRRARIQLVNFNEFGLVNVDLLDAAGAGATWESAPGQTLRLRSQPVPLTAGRSDPLTSLEGRYTVRVSNGNTELVYREIELFAGQTTRVEP